MDRIELTMIFNKPKRKSITIEGETWYYAVNPKKERDYFQTPFYKQLCSTEPSFTAYCDIENPVFTKEEVKSRIMDGYKIYLREQEIEKGEII